jgi:hypothetical protein
MISEDHHGEGSSTDRGAGSGAEAADPTGDALSCGASSLSSLASLEDLARWRDEVIGAHRQLVLGASAVPGAARCARGGEGSSVALPVAFSRLEALLAAGFDRMRTNGELAVDADPARLATGLTAALQGGSLLARATRDTGRLEAALDVALSQVRSHSAW